MADSVATLTGAPPVVGARAMRSRSNTPKLLHDIIVTDAVVHRPRLRATLHAGGAAPPAQFVMRGQRIVAPTGPVCWIATGATDATGSQYIDGPSALDGATIVCVGRLP